ncbi:MAG: polyprenol monophosphomannose synthase [Patescibacteria group bacterium]
MKDVILLPTYNERENIKIIIPEVLRLWPRIFILVIDDNSPDGTAQSARSLMNEYPQVSLLQRQNKTGLGAAYIEAMQQVIQDKEVRFIITMDADGSHAPRYLKDFLAYGSEYDLIIGSRYVRGGGVAHWEAWRKLLSRFGNIYARLLAGLPVRDCTSGFMCIKRDILARARLHDISSVGYSFLIELKFQLINILGARVKEVPIVFQSRQEGESKISNQIISEGMKAPWRLLKKRIWKQ